MNPHKMTIVDNKATDKKGTIKRLSTYLYKYKYNLIFVNIFCAIGIILSSISPILAGNITTKIYNDVTNGKSIDFQFIIRLLVIISIIYLLSATFLYLQSFVITKICQNVVYKLRKDVDEKISRLPLKYIDSKTHGAILSNITNDVETVNSSLQQILTQVINTIITIISIVVMMLTISPILMFVMLLTLPLTFIATQKIAVKSQGYFKSQQNTLSEINSHVEEMYSGHQILKVFNKENSSIENLKHVNDKWYNFSYKAQFLSGLMMPIVMFISNLGYVLIAIVGGVLASMGSITIGNIQAFIEYVRQFNQPISQMANIANIFQSTIAASERIFNLLDEEDQTKDVPQSYLPEIIKGKVEFKNVKFGYSDDKVLINDLSFVAQPGKVIAIVGPTGAGKTTIINLLMRFYDIHEGDILIDGCSVYNMTRSDLRNLFGMVLQDTWLFNGSIKANIHYGNERATDEEVIESAKFSHADYFIQLLNGKYDFVLNEELSNISEGQKQLLTISRAILSDPKILILDEATSNVDTRTELLIQIAMKKLMKGRTSFVIAHRLSTIRDADLILVLKDGDIVEQGNHEELLAYNGYYSELFKSQFEE